MADTPGAAESDKEVKAYNLECLLTQIASHLPFPYLNRKIIEDSTSMATVWSIIYKHYGCSPTPMTFLDYAKLKRKPSESALTFYERMLYHSRTHLAKTGAVVDTTTNATDDVMTISLQNHIALDWIRRLHPDLLNAVSVAYAVELRQGTHLASLVPRIAENLDDLLKRNGGGSVNHVDAQDTEPVDSPAEVNYLGDSRYGQARGGTASRYRGGNRGRGNTSWRGGQGSARPDSRGQNAGNRFCPSCDYLGKQLQLDVNKNHYPADCRRRNSAMRLLQLEEEAEEEQHDDDPEVEEES